MAWLVDTNVLSELRRPKPSVVDFVAGCPLDQLYVSVVTLAEIRFGIELINEPTRRAELNEWLAHKVRPMFGERVLEVTEEIMLKWRLFGRGGPQDGPYLLPAGPNNSSDRHSSRAVDRHA